jgi:hypothetical protein
MTRIALPFLLLLTANVLLAQSHVFDSRLLPGKTYRHTINTTLNAVTAITGDSSFMAALPKGQNSYELDSHDTTRLALHVGKANANLPLTIVMKRDTRTTKAGKYSESHLPAAGFRYQGTCDAKGIIQLDSIPPENLGDDAFTWSVFLTKVRTLLQMVPYPNRALTLGDSFQQPLPVKIFFSGYSEIKMKGTMIYTLRELKKDRAIFDIVITIDGTSSPKTAASGSGKGTAEVDLTSHTVSRLTTSMDLELKLVSKASNDAGKSMGSITMTSKVKSGFDQAVAVE